jgi:hypothetical protein
MEEYAVDNNPYLAFVKECIVADEEADKIVDKIVDQKKIYGVFLEWCAQEGLTEERKANPNVKAFMKNFRLAVKNANILITAETHSDNIYRLSGIRLSPRGEEVLEAVKKR